MRAGRGARAPSLVVFPELGLSAYTCDDLFHQRALLDAAEEALARAARARRAGCRSPRWSGCRCAVERPAVQLRGARLPRPPARRRAEDLPAELPRVLRGAPVHARRHRARAPRSELAGQRRAVRHRPDLPGRRAARPASCTSRSARTCGCRCRRRPTPRSPARRCSPTSRRRTSRSARPSYRHQLVGNQSARCLAAYLYSAAGHGRVDHRPRLGRPCADLRERHAARRVGALRRHAAARRRRRRPRAPRRRPHAPEHLRRRGAAPPRATCAASARVDFSLPSAGREAARWNGEYERFPTCPADPTTRDERCEEVYHIQVQGLATRLRATGIKKLVIGVSGGLDSTHALLVCARAMDQLELPRSEHPRLHHAGLRHHRAARKSQAWQLMRAIGCSAEEIDIRPSCMQMLKDIGHPYAQGPAGLRHHLRERAGGRAHQPPVPPRQPTTAAWWSAPATSPSSRSAGRTYGVGDHMSHYNVNAQRAEDADQAPGRAGWPNPTSSAPDVKRALRRVLDTEISPELVPGNQASRRAMRRPLRAAGLQPLLHAALRLRADQGRVPRLARLARQVQAARESSKWLGVFLQRFFETSQFKRSAVPNAPKVGSAARSRRAATGARPRTATRPPGCKTLPRFLTGIDEHAPRRQRVLVPLRLPREMTSLTRWHHRS